MQYIIQKISFPTTEPIEIVDITEKVKALVADCGITNGLVTLISNHTTAYININEREEMLLKDMATYLKRLVPRDGDYLHNLKPIDGRDNAHAHLMGLFMNTSESIPLSAGKFILGEWQSVFFIELDGPREKRSVTIQIIGE
ncbi:protein of unknown function UPF0047 [Chloroherpeton thalassium ATCC 35110]|uniref:Secondary thiamine-phosphate synthase enzyme n=1 Tax=Chloroherpeton thalassium (strain ATCC 35110 / GB-78) TaxID=517418 RepID=B3QT66_CHLT3|nr:secondary thiamine-phosphate synthase enzyme YjbQ [Chloroherpeton thalassium]ACF14165.1 protein of unknown function UPF0047 [Chloroherpeton thalassium ATCC 35110]